jgi:hypothetical protein
VQENVAGRVRLQEGRGMRTALLARLLRGQHRQAAECRRTVSMPQIVSTLRQMLLVVVLLEFFNFFAVLSCPVYTTSNGKGECVLKDENDFWNNK